MAEMSPENYMHGRLQDKRKRLSPETGLCGVTVSNWRSSSIQPSSFIYVIFLSVCFYCFCSVIHSNSDRPSSKCILKTGVGRLTCVIAQQYIVRTDIAINDMWQKTLRFLCWIFGLVDGFSVNVYTQLLAYFILLCPPPPQNHQYVCLWTLLG